METRALITQAMSYSHELAIAKSKFNKLQRMAGVMAGMSRRVKGSEAKYVEDEDEVRDGRCK